MLRGGSAPARARATAGSTAERGVSMRTAAQASPLVSPRVVMATGVPASPACFTNRKPDHTVSEEPTTHRTSPSPTAARARATRSFGTFSPKKVRFGLSTPPQWRQAGTRNERSSSRGSSASPSGVI